MLILITQHSKSRLLFGLLLGLLSFGSTTSLAAQTMPRTVIGNTGEYLDHLLFGTLNFTVGEVAVSRYQVDMDLAEGFHRAYYDLVVSNKELLPADWGVSVYPNPTTEYLRIVLPEAETLVSAQLFGSNGQLLLRQDDFHLETELDLQNLPAGTYWLRITDKNGRQGSFQIQKIVR